MVIHLNMLLGSEHAVAKQDMVPSWTTHAVMIVLTEHAVEIIVDAWHGQMITLTACSVAASCCCNLVWYVMKFTSRMSMARSSSIMLLFTPYSDSMHVHLNMLSISENAVAKQDMLSSWTTHAVMIPHMDNAVEIFKMHNMFNLTACAIVSSCCCSLWEYATTVTSMQNMAGSCYSILLTETAWLYDGIIATALHPH
jgi:hypothetical protein